MKISTISAAVLSVLACAAMTAGAADLKIGIVDMEKLVKSHPNSEADRKLLEETAKEFAERRDAMRAQVEAAVKAFEAAAKEAQNAALSEKARKSREEEAMQKREAAVAAEKNYTEQMRDMQQQLNESQARMLKRTYTELQAAVAAYAKENGYTFIAEAPSGDKANSPASVVYYDPSLDITQAIMDRLGLSEPAIDPAPAAE